MKKEHTRIQVKVIPGKKDAICMAEDGKVGLIANDYRKSGKRMPLIGEVWTMAVIHETERYFIGIPEEMVHATPAD